MIGESVYYRCKRGIEVSAKETNYSACTEEMGRTSQSSVDEEEEYRDFGGYLPAAKPGRYVHA